MKDDSRLFAMPATRKGNYVAFVGAALAAALTQPESYGAGVYKSRPYRTDQRFRSASRLDEQEEIYNTKRKAQMLALAWAALFAAMIEPLASIAKPGCEPAPEPISYLAPAPAQAASITVNEFIMNGGSIGKTSSAPVEISAAPFKVRLLTPLSSLFNLPGDSVTAVVNENIPGQLGTLLPIGTKLYGTIEGLQENGRMRKEGNLAIHFYQCDTPEGRLDLDFAPISRDGRIHPLKANSKISRKQQLNHLLTASSRIAIPLAIGSGGLSLAITAGAGTILGALLADNGRYLQGAAKGAWYGSGLSLFEPLIFKGPPVRLPAGSEITVRALEPLKIPSNALRVAAQRAPASNQASAVLPVSPTSSLLLQQALLSTTARLLTATSSEPARHDEQSKRQSSLKDPLERLKESIEQKNLAAAIDALDSATRLYPGDPEVERYRQELVFLTTGHSSGE